MALTKAKKAVQIDQLAHELEGSTSAIVGTFAKLTVSQDFELRKVVRGAGGRYRVVKNKLAARASKGTKVEQALQGLKGVSSVAYTSGDPVALAKALSTWMQENAEFTFKLGIIDGQVITVEEVKQLATMPSKEQIFAKLLFLINAPAQRLVTVMNAAGRDLAVVINQAVEQGKFAAPAKPAAVEAAPEAPKAETPKAEPVAAAPAETVVAAAVPETVVPEVEAPKPEPVAAAPAEAAVATAVPETIAPEAEAAGTNEDSQTAAAATEAPTEG
jgi:large subunit ribosomal protein L10